MRILILSPDPDRSEQAIFDGLASRGVDVRLLSRTQHPSLACASVAGFFPSSRISPRTISLIRHHLRDFSPDIVYSLSARALSNALFATWGQSMCHVAYRGTMGHLSRLDPAAHLSFLNRRVDSIICVSHAVRQYLITQGVDASRAVTIHKGHDTSWYNSTNTPARSQLGLSESAFVVGCVANVRPVKGVDLLLQAMQYLPAELNVELLLVGEIRDSTVQTLLERGPARTRIRHLGFRKDATQLLRCCDLVAMTSRRREGLPRSVIEGMSQALPALVTAVGGMPELVQDSVSGRVIQSLDPRAIAEGIAYFARDRERSRKMGLLAKERIQNSFAIASTIERHYELFTDLLRRNTHAAV